MPSVIKLIVADKQIGAVLRLVKPYALDPPVVDPMDDTPTSPAFKKGAKISAVLVQYVAGLPVKSKVRAGDLSQLCKQSNAHPNGYSYVLKKMLKEKTLGRTKEPNTYEVLKHG